MAILNVVVDLPERQNTFFNQMSGLLPNKIFNVGGDFMIPRLEPVTIKGTVVPLSTVKVFINGLDKSPVPDIVADDLGSWSGQFFLTPGQNVIQVQFFPPDIQQQIDDNLVDGFAQQEVLIHPTLFSPFGIGNNVTDMRLDGTDLFIGSGVGIGLNSMVKYDLTTGQGTFLAFGSDPLSAGNVRVFSLDSNWLYSSQTMGDASIKVSRYAKDFSTRMDLTYGTVPNYLHADGTHLFVVRDTGGDSLLSKVDPATMTMIGAEISIKNGALSESFIKHNAMADDGTHVVIPTSRQIIGDSPGNSYLPGSPDLGANLILWNLLFHRQVRKSDMANLGNFTTYATFNFPDEPDFIGKNSLIRLGGFYYALVLSNPGKVIKLQEGTVDSQPDLEPIEVTPLPIDTSGDIDDLPARMKLGPDGRLYVAGIGGIVRFTPGSASIQWIPRGEKTIEVTLDDVAVVDDGDLKRVLSAGTAIFPDRAQTFTIMTPVAAPTNVRCHFNETHTAIGVGWDSTDDGSAYIVEQALNAGSFTEVRREYFGSGMFIQSAHLPSFVSGDTLRYRVKAFNSVGTSVPSAEATFLVPFLTPFLGDCDNLVTISVLGNNVTLEFEDNEIALGQPIDSMTNRPHVLFLYRSPDGLTNWTEVAARSMIPDNVQPDGTPVGGDFTYNPSTRANTLVQMSDTNAGAYPYFYRVRAEQRDSPSLGFPSFRYGPGGYSNVLQVDAPPAMPTGVFWEAGWEGAYVAWTPGVGGGAVTGYTVKRSTDNGVSYPTSFVLGNVTSFHDTTAFGNSHVRYDKVSAQGPGGSSADAPIQGGAVSLTPVHHEVHITNTGSSGGPLFVDGSFAYFVAGDASGVNVTMTKVSLADSSIRTQNMSLYVPIGTFTTIGDGLMFGGFIYLLIKDQGEANAKIIKVDPSTMTVVGSSLSLTGTNNLNLVSDGTDCWATCGSNGSVRVTHFNPTTMSNIATGSTLGSGVGGVFGATAFSGKLFITVHNFNTAQDQISRIDPSTLGIVETVNTNAATFPDAMTNDGSNIYFHGTSGSNGRVEKFSTGPLTFIAGVNLGLNNVTSLAYSATANAIFMAHRQMAFVDGTDNSLIKLSTAPAFVSAISQLHFNGGVKNAARTDGTYAYFASNNGYIARELLTAF